MMTDPLRNVSDATIVLCASWALGGWLLGSLTTLVLFWRPIRRQRASQDEAQIYRRALQDVEQREQELRSENTRLALKLASAHQALKRRSAA